VVDSPGATSRRAPPASLARARRPRAPTQIAGTLAAAAKSAQSRKRLAPGESTGRSIARRRSPGCHGSRAGEDPASSGIRLVSPRLQGVAWRREVLRGALSPDSVLLAR
jgi:hypothetical protein